MRSAGATDAIVGENLKGEGFKLPASLRSYTPWAFPRRGRASKHVPAICSVLALHADNMHGRRANLRNPADIAAGTLLPSSARTIMERRRSAGEVLSMPIKDVWDVWGEMQSRRGGVMTSRMGSFGETQRSSAGAPLCEAYRVRRWPGPSAFAAPHSGWPDGDHKLCCS